MILASQGKGQITLFDPKKKERVKIIENAHHENRVYGLEQINKNQFVSCGGDNLIKIWNITKFSIEKELAGHSNDIWCIKTFGPNRLLSGSGDNTIRLWSISSQRCLRVWNLYTQMNTLCIQVVDGQHFVTGCWERAIRLWKQSQHLVVRVLRGMDQICFSLQMMKNKTHVLAGYNCGYIIQWNLCNGQQVQKFRPHWGRINKLIYLYDNIITTVSSDGQLKILNMNKN